MYNVVDFGTGEFVRVASDSDVAAFNDPRNARDFARVELPDGTVRLETLLWVGDPNRDD